VRYQTVRGTRDILPGEVEAWQRAETLARDVFRRYGFREIRTPIFEATELFARGVGGSTDIVRKEMYSFTAGDDAITLRPEMTASVVRAYIQHGLSRVAGAERLYYIGPMFRRERPQKGRQRQFHQIGVEVLRVRTIPTSTRDHRDGDVVPGRGRLDCGEASEAGERQAKASPFEDRRVVVNSVGDAACQASAFRERAPGLARGESPAGGRSRRRLARRERLCEDCQRRLVENPLRVFDCKVPPIASSSRRLPRCSTICATLPRRTSNPSAAPGRRWAFRTASTRARAGARLLRAHAHSRSSPTAGSDPRTRSWAGGATTGFVKELGGPGRPGFGWAAGRSSGSCCSSDSMPAPPRAEAPSWPAQWTDVYLAHVGERASALGAPLARDLRGHGLSVRFDPRGGKLGAQLGKAAKAGRALRPHPRR
jgi:histidyl-tRNA synthetase